MTSSFPLEQLQGIHEISHLSMELISYAVSSLLVESLDFRLVLIYPLCLSLRKTMHNQLLIFLQLTDSNRRFSFSVLKILVEDRRETHVERVNDNKNIIQLVVGDIEMARIAVQSDASTSKVAKLSYQVRGPFRSVI